MVEHNRHSEQGAALLVALLAVTFLTILGMVLLEVLRGGLVQAASTEASIQAEALAQSGIDEVTALIRNAVIEANKNASSTTYVTKVDQVQLAVDALIPVLHNKRVDGLRGFYNIEIDNQDNRTSYNANIDKIDNYPYSRIITVKSTGTVSANVRSVEKVAQLYVSTINPVFKYPLSAFGNLTLNGAPYVVGDILSREGNLVVSDKAEFVGGPGTHYDMVTAYPTVKGFYKAENRLDVSKFSNFAPFIDSHMPDDEPIDVDAYVQAQVNKKPVTFGAIAPLGDIEGHVQSSNVMSSIQYIDQWVDFQGGFSIDSSTTDSSFLVDNGVLTFSDNADVTIKKGSLYVKYNNIDGTAAAISAAHFAGKLTIEDPSHAVVVEGNAVMADGFHLKGNMYIDGSLKIIGSVNIEGALFVKGEVEMNEMKSINKDIDSGIPLLLAASGKMTFANSRPLADATGHTPTTAIRAFLYSEDALELYGVMTKLQFTGGVHGNEVTLNAVREDASNLVLGPEVDIKLTPTAAQLQLTPLESNLKIFYDDILYRSPPVGIPVTNKVNLFVESN